MPGGQQADSRGPLDQRLHDYCGEAVRSQRRDPIEICCPLNRKMDGSESAREGVDSSEAGCAGGVAVIRIFEGDQPALFRPAAQLPILNCHFYSHFHGRGPIVGIKRAGQTARRKTSGKFLGEFDGGGIG